MVGSSSNTFTKPEQNQNTTEKEAWVVVLSIRHFHLYLKDTKFKMFTDIQAVTHSLNGSQPKTDSLDG